GSPWVGGGGRAAPGVDLVGDLERRPLGALDVRADPREAPLSAARADGLETPVPGDGPPMIVVVVSVALGPGAGCGAAPSEGHDPDAVAGHRPVDAGP